MTDIETLLHSLKEDSVAAPTEEFRTNSRIRILNTVTQPQPLRAGWYRRPRVIGYTFGSALATILLSVGTVYAAQSSPPDSRLFPVKVLSERVALTLSPTEDMKTAVAQTIISRRIEEVEEEQRHGNARDVEASINRLNNDVSSIKKRKDISRDRIENTLTEHQELFNAINKDEEDDAQDNTQESERTVTSTPSVKGAEKKEDSPTPTVTQTEIRIPRVEGVTSEHDDD